MVTHYASGVDIVRSLRNFYLLGRAKGQAKFTQRNLRPVSSFVGHSKSELASMVTSGGEREAKGGYFMGVY